MPAFHAGDPGSNPGQGAFLFSVDYFELLTLPTISRLPLSFKIQTNRT